MTIVLSTPPYQAFYDSNGDPLNGGFIYTYIAGTLTPTPTYTDQGGLTQHTNPIELDSAGRIEFWLDSAVSYKYIIKDSLLNTIETVDNVTPFSAATGLAALGSIAANTIVGNNTGSSATPVAMTVAQATAMLSPLQLRSISASVAASALTISASALTLDFRSATLGSGTITTVSGTPANLVISSGSTLGTVSAVQSRILILAINNAGTIELAAINQLGAKQINESGVISTTAEGGAGGADTLTTIYSTTARTNVAYRVLGYIESTQATAGTWATAPSTIQGFGGNSTWAPSLFVSTDQTITSAGLLTLAHGLGVVPKLTAIEFINVTDEAGWVTGDVVMGSYIMSETAERDLVAYTDATNVYIRFGTAAAILGFPHKTTGTFTTMTNANWNLRVKAWA